MPFLRRFNILAYILALLSIVGFTFAEENLPYLLFATVGLLISWWLVEGPNGRTVPRWVINAGVLMAALYLFWEVVIQHQENLILALGHLIIGLLLCKLFESKSNRDYGQILILTLLIIMSASILGTSLVFGVVLISYLCIGLYACLIFHLRCETTRFAKRHPEAAPDHMPAAKIRLLRRDLRRTTLGSAVALFIISVATFLAIPRTHAGVLGNWRESHGNTVTGFSDHVAFGDIGRLQQSNAIAMEVRLERNGTNIGSPDYQPYFRGLTLDQYDPRQRAWVRSPSFQNEPSIGLEENRSGSTLDPARYRDCRTFISQKYTLEIYNTPTLFTIDPPATIRSNSLRTVTVSHRDDTLTFQDRPQAAVDYEIESPENPTPLTEAQLKASQEMPQPLYEELWRTAAGRHRHRWMRSMDPAHAEEMPDVITPAVVDLAKQVVGPALMAKAGADDPAVDQQIAEKIERYLRTTYPYSLNSKQVDERLDPTEDFLLNRKKTGGHCEYFASAMIFMSRAAGIPADRSRMVTGYHGGEFNNVGGYYSVRQKYAHAWVELFIKGRGWEQFDPSPANTALEGGTGYAWVRWTRQVFENFQKNWLNSIINFDNHSRKSLFGKVGAGFAGFKVKVAAFLERLRATVLGESSRWEVTVLGTVLALLLLTMAAALGRWLAFRRGIVFALIRNMDRRARRQLRQDLAFFDQLAHILRKTGTHREASQTPREFTDAASQIVPTAALSVRRLTDLFYEIRYANLYMTPALKSEITGHLAALQASVNAHRHRPPHGPTVPTNAPEVLAP